MKLIALLALLPIVYSQPSRLQYPADIGSYAFTYANGNSAEVTSQPDAAMITTINNGDTADQATLTKPTADRWNIDTGMSGTFEAKGLVPGANKFFRITEMSITFATDCDLVAAGTSVSAYYYQRGSGVRTILDGTQTSVNGKANTFTYTSTDGFAVDSSAGLGFQVTFIPTGNDNAECEGDVFINEFSIIGEATSSDSPTKSPSSLPSQSPTTLAPTLGPTRQCKGEVTWGDPHYKLIAMRDNVDQLNYQGLGWYYYLFPCDIERDYNDWPFYLMSKHDRCYYRGSRKGCIGGNRVIINTKPNPWIIGFKDKTFEIIQVGSDVLNRDKSDFNDDARYYKRNPFVIDYDDGGLAYTGAPQQSGELRIYEDSGEIVLEFHNVAYNSYPRTCNRGEGFGAECGTHMCEGKVIEMRNSGSWTVFTCPNCLRNIACGLMGKFYRGDCSQSQLNDRGNKCSELLAGADGTQYGPPINDDTFGQFADTWNVDAVKPVLESYGLSEVTGLREDGQRSSMKYQWKTYSQRRQTNNVPKKEGRMGLAVTDASFYDGLCKDDMVKIRQVNETCRQNTVVKYDRCCKEIGICPMLWKACIEDLCSCAAPNGNNTWTEDMCLDQIIHESMNTTCSWDALWPTATPTATPTKSPTGLVAGLPRGKKAMDLIWLYLIFVVIFVIIAGGAYYYYRKKNKVMVEFPEDEEQAEQRDMETGGTNTEVYS